MVPRLVAPGGARRRPHPCPVRFGRRGFRGMKPKEAIHHAAASLVGLQRKIGDSQTRYRTHLEAVNAESADSLIVGGPVRSVLGHESPGWGEKVLREAVRLSQEENPGDAPLPRPAGKTDEHRVQAAKDVRHLLVSLGADCSREAAKVMFEEEIGDYRVGLHFSFSSRWVCGFGGEFFWPVETANDVLALFDMMRRAH